MPAPNLNISDVIQKKNGKEVLKKTLTYCFSDIPAHSIDEMMGKIELVNNGSNDDYYKIIFSVYAGLKPEDKKFPISNEDYLSQKANRLSDAVKEQVNLFNQEK